LQQRRLELWRREVTMTRERECPHTVALVLAGGRGSRLKQLTDWRAKPAVPFGGKLRIIDFPLSNCINSGIRRIGVLTQYKAQSLIRHIQRGWGFLESNLGEFIEVIPAQQRGEQGWYAGTANAVFQNLDLLPYDDTQYVVILAGDHVYKMDYSRMLADHIANRADVTVACTEIALAAARNFGIVTVSPGSRLTAFQEKPASPQAMPGHPDKALASMGIYIFGAGILFEELARDDADPASSHDFGRDLLPYLVAHRNVFAHRFLDSCVNMVGNVPYWRDVGTIDAYWEANIDLTRVVPELNLYDDSWPIWTLQRQEPPAKFVFDSPRLGAAIDSLVAGGCIVSGATVRRSLLSTGVHVQEGSTIEDSVILPKVAIGKGVRLKRAIVEKFCILPDGFQAGLDRHRDRQRFHVTDSGIVLVTPEMLGQHVHRTPWTPS
jgi:glucose-1-phosphate adenylyltransferase